MVRSGDAGGGLVLVVAGVVWEGEKLPSKCCAALGCSVRCLLAKGGFSPRPRALGSTVPGGERRGCGEVSSLWCGGGVLQFLKLL